MKRSVTILFLASSAVACSSGKDGPQGDDDDTTETDPPTGDLSQIYVNELMAINQTGLQDELGRFTDWVELYNPNDTDADLSGWWLSDDVDDPFKGQVPDGIVIPAGGYLVFYLDNDSDEGALHLDFRLDGLGGEDLALFGPNVLDNPLVDSVEDMAIQYPDYSLARMPDGGPTWEEDDTSTPNAANN